MEESDSETQEQVKVKNVMPEKEEKEMNKSIRQILNRVTEGNIDVMFKSLQETINTYMDKYPNEFASSYAKIFSQMVIGL